MRVDCFSGYAYDVVGRNEADEVGFSASASWGWLVAGLGGRLLGDGFGIARMVWIWFGEGAGWLVILGLGDGVLEFW